MSLWGKLNTISSICLLNLNNVIITLPTGTKDRYKIYNLLNLGYLSERVLVFLHVGIREYDVFNGIYIFVRVLNGFIMSRSKTTTHHFIIYTGHARTLFLLKLQHWPCDQVAINKFYQRKVCYSHHYYNPVPP